MRLALAGLLAGGCATMLARAPTPGVDEIAGCYHLTYGPLSAPPGRSFVVPTDSLPALLELRADRLANWPYLEEAGERPYVARALHRDGRESSRWRFWLLRAPDSLFVSEPLPFSSVDLYLRWSDGTLHGRVRNQSDNLSQGSSSAAVSGRRAPCEGSG